MRRTIFCSMFLFVTIVLVQIGWSQIPQTVSYQGILTDSAGVVINGTVGLTFNLYEAETGGTAVWTEIQNEVPVSDGIFNVILGSVSPLGIPFERQYWLGVTIGGQPEITPLVQLTASPYSLNAQSISGTSNVFPSDGNVGIGTTNPNEKLEVDGNVKVSGTGNGIIFPDGTVQSTASVLSGVDWSSTTPNFWTSETQSITYSTVADVIGSGYLMSIQQNHFNTQMYNYGYLKIVIDGNVLKDSWFSVIQYIYDGTKITGYYSSPCMLSGLFRFNSSLQVYHRTVVEGCKIQTSVSFVRD